MKNRFLVLALIGLSLLSCKKNEEPNVEATPEPPKEETVADECYEFVEGKDTIQAHLMLRGENVTGDMAYKFFEKDKSSGPVVGTIKGDTLLVEYTFQSEGMQSVREVAFLRSENTLTEGLGEIEEKDGKVILKNKQQLQFAGTVLNKVPCK